MRPHQLQVGFLKLLRGTHLYEKREAYGLICSGDAPYEVLQTRWISFEELDRLRRISDRVEEFVNSQGFRRTLKLAVQMFTDPFHMFEELESWYLASAAGNVGLALEPESAAGMLTGELTSWDTPALESCVCDADLKKFGNGTALGGMLATA